MPKNSSDRSHCHRCGKADRHASLNIGFVPIIDGAVLIAAQELGLFSKHGLCVRLSKEVGWATIREKLVHEELDAAHAPASMAFAVRCGIGLAPRPCLTGIILSTNGSAITLSRELWERGVRDASSLKALIDSERNRRVFSFGAVLELSTQNYNLRRWLQSGGIDPDRDVRIPIIPSPLVHHGLLDGHLDGYCVAEPWNSIVTQEGSGWVVATSAEIDPRMPEKILLVLEKFEENRHDEHQAMIAALIEAGVYCDQPANRPELIRILAQPRYLDVSEEVLKNSLMGPFDSGKERRQIDDFIVFHREGANIPDRVKGRRVFREVRRMRVAQECKALRPDTVGRIFREDLFHAARRRVGLWERNDANHSPDASKNGSTASDQEEPPVIPRRLSLAMAV